MLRIKMTINENGVYLSGMYIDGNERKQNLMKTCCDERHAFDTIELMRENGCEFSLSVMRKV